MSERVTQFLISLSQDPVLLDNFLNNPDPLLGDSLLTAEERSLLRSGDAEEIRKHLGDTGPTMWTATTSTEPNEPPKSPPPKTPPPPPKH
jgi:hypothetical protein